MNKIIVTPDDRYKISDFMKRHDIKETADILNHKVLDTFHPIFDDVQVIQTTIGGTTRVYSYKKLGGIDRHELGISIRPKNNDLSMTYIGIVRFHLKDFSSLQVESMLGEASTDELLNCIASFILYNLYVSEYVEILEDSSEIVKKDVKKSENKDVNIKHGGDNVIYISKIKHKYKTHNTEKRIYHKPTREVQVRGHYRRYKSGKTVWVNGFKKYKGSNAHDNVYKI